MNEFLTRFGPPFLESVFLFAVLGYLFKRSRDTAKEGVLDYHPAIKALAWVLITLAAGTIFFSIVFLESKDRLEMFLYSIVPALLGSYLLLETHFTNGKFNDETIELESIFREKRVGYWEHLTEASFKKNGQYFSLRFSDGVTIEYSAFLRGSSNLRNHIERLGLSIKDIDKSGW